MVTGYEEAIAVLRPPGTFSSATVVAGPDDVEAAYAAQFARAHRVQGHPRRIPHARETAGRCTGRP
jgi:hypothetical protein